MMQSKIETHKKTEKMESLRIGREFRRRLEKTLKKGQVYFPFFQKIYVYFGRERKRRLFLFRVRLLRIVIKWVKINL